MPDKVFLLKNVQGLSAQEAITLQHQHGKNTFNAAPPRNLARIILNIVKEPMFIMLIIACSLYFILGEASEGIMMLAAMILVTAISLYQEVKSSNALKSLQQLAGPTVTAVRDGEDIVLPSEELVPGDIMLLDEGMNIPADAILLQDNDFSVNESVITGESLPVDKNVTQGHNILYQGTTINSGKCIARVTETGNNTVLGKLGKTVGTYMPPKTPLQQQINRFVNRLALFGLVAFLLIFLVNYLHYREWAASLLFALTLAMSAIPEEIPVAFSSFMALGAYKMSKLGIISRQPQIIENLGAVSVICLDKTGTITENKMIVKSVYDYQKDALIELKENTKLQSEKVLFYGMLASETDPFDAMEKAILDAYHLYADSSTQQCTEMIYEYPLQGKPPMMTHVYEQDGKKIIAGKGAAERIINVCKLNEIEKTKITEHINSLTSKGYRVIGVASAAYEADIFPATQDDFNWQFEGLLALYDPPKKNVPDVLKQFMNAGIDVKIITGDHPGTAINIAGQVGIQNHLNCICGDEVITMSGYKLKEVVKTVNVFARMFPDAKLKIIESLKENGEITAMTGDGINDGPALKSANVGIAMGKRGTEIARLAADLILTDDNLERMVTAISEGRKIFNNLKKAVRYIISIHIPIILIASLPVIFGWAYPNVFTPIHVIFLELIMGPTCSIFFENEPAEINLMQHRSGKRNSVLFTNAELLTSIIQGIIIAAGSLFLYYYFMNNGSSLSQTRTIVFTTLIISNVFLTFTNRSFTKTIFHTSRYKNSLAPFIIIVSTGFLAVLHFVPYVRNLFRLTNISTGQFLLCIAVAFASVMWFEVYKTGLKKINII